MSELSFVINGMELYTEKVLVEFEIPLLFICKDKTNEKYSVLCVDSEKERYMIVNSEVADIIDMIQNTITIKELFLRAKNGIAWIVEVGNTVKNDSESVINVSDVKDYDMPLNGAFYEVYNKDIHDYVNILKEYCN